MRIIKRIYCILSKAGHDYVTEQPYPSMRCDRCGSYPADWMRDCSLKYNRG